MIFEMIQAVFLVAWMDFYCKCLQNTIPQAVAVTVADNERTGIDTGCAAVDLMDPHGEVTDRASHTWEAKLHEIVRCGHAW